MAHPFSTAADEFYVNMRLGSQMALPTQRDTVLHFFDRIQREFPGMTRFRKTEAGEFSLEEARSSDSYRWVTLDTRRLSSGFVNPEEVGITTHLHTFLLELAPFHLGLSPLEIDYLDVLYGFDMECRGNHDEVIAESVLVDSPLMCLGDSLGAKPLDVQPTVTFALSDDCRLQGRIDVITRTDSAEVRSGEFKSEMISVYLILRRYWGDRPKQSFMDVFASLTDRAEQICNDLIVPRVLRPISTAIASRS